jgi:catalase
MDLSTTVPAADLPRTRGLWASFAEHTRAFNSAVSWSAITAGAAAAASLSLILLMDFISNQFRHGKTLLAIGASQALLERAGASASLASGEPDPGILIGAAAKVERVAADFIVTLGRHRHPERETSALAP